MIAVDNKTPSMLESPTATKTGDTLSDLNALTREAIRIKRQLECHIGRLKALIEKLN